jgi:hypothetical protein
MRNPARRRGIAPMLLFAQVEGTARWALEGEVPAQSWRDWLLAAKEIEDRWQEPESRVEYLRAMLAAHFTTVATFVPTDVDTHIRYHVWQEIESESELEDALAVVDEAARWDPSAVSARVVDGISGHAGEWLAVRAGALGRALAIGARDVADRIAAQIERELEVEAEAFARAKDDDDFVRALSLATISAHNCGDLSRVVLAWPASTPKREDYAARLARLGHEGASRFGGAHHLAGHLNKEVMASENHRFLAMRGARCLRRSRTLLVPIGPFFDRWGASIGASALLEEEDRGEVLAALLHGLDQAVDRWGYHRAIAGLHQSSPGGIDRLESYVPARLRRSMQKGPVRDALRTSEERFLARIEKAWKVALASYRR